MIFSRFFSFKPKWQHKNSRIRRQALEQLDERDPQTATIYAQAVTSDPDPVLRQWLLKHIADLELLARVASEDPDATVREHALQRSRRLISGVDAGLDGAARRAALVASSDSRLWDFVAHHAPEVELRRAAMLKLDRDALYGDIACNDPDPALRVEAAQRIQQAATLERVLKVAKTKDKRVRGEIQERLAHLHDLAARPQQLQRELKQLCVKLEAELGLLNSYGHPERVAVAAGAIQRDWDERLRQWRQLGLKDEEGLIPRFAKAQKALSDALANAERDAAEQAITEQRREQAIALCGRLETEVATLRQLGEPGEEHIAAAKRVDAEIEQAWSARPSLPEAMELELQKRYARARHELASAGASVRRYLDAQVALRELIAEAESAPTEVAAEQLSRWVARRAEIAAATPIALPATLCAQWESVYGQRAGMAEQRSADAAAAAAEFKAGVGELDQLLEAGQSKPAVALAHRLQELLRNLPPAVAAGLRRQKAYRRFQAAQAQLQELRDWQGFASTPLRERLCEEMAALAEEVEAHANDPAYDFSAAAQQVRKARDRWQGLGTAEPDKAEVLWARFNELCKRAYGPCERVFERLARERGEHLAQRQALCERLEEYVRRHVEAQADAGFDSREAETVLRSAQQEWQRIGPTDRKEHAAVAQRYRAATEAIKAELRAQRERNQARKESLIKRADQVHEQAKADAERGAPLDEAVDQIKQLQVEWKSVGRAAKESELWLRFRAACDGVFGQRQARFDFQAQERRANLSQRQTYCALVETMAALEGEELLAARPRVAQMKAEWSRLGAVPKEDARAIEKRFKEACAAFEARCSAWHDDARRRSAEALRLKGMLCERLEGLADGLIDGTVMPAGVETQLGDVIEAWRRLPDLGDSIERALAERRRRAEQWLQALARGDAGARAAAVQALERARLAHRQTRQALCLRMELLAGVESPPEAKQARLEMQVAQLADKMQRSAGGPARPVAEEAYALLEAWHAAGPVPVADQDALASRFELAWAAALGQKQGGERPKRQAGSRVP